MSLAGISAGVYPQNCKWPGVHMWDCHAHFILHRLASVIIIIEGHGASFTGIGRIIIIR